MIGDLSSSGWLERQREELEELLERALDHGAGRAPEARRLRALERRREAWSRSLAAAERLVRELEELRSDAERLLWAGDETSYRAAWARAVLSELEREGELIARDLELASLGADGAGAFGEGSSS